tara:strand:+ start:3329 stop:3658 length:330 start_codon:yes stop_codon:yes gene_type:complete
MLELFFGLTPDQAVEVKADGDWHQTEHTTPEPGHILTRGYVVGWSRAVISTTARSSGKRRTFVLVPSDEAGVLALGTFKAVGSFSIEEKINNARKACDAFEECELELLR